MRAAPPPFPSRGVVPSHGGLSPSHEWLPPDGEPDRSDVIQPTLIPSARQRRLSGAWHGRATRTANSGWERPPESIFQLNDEPERRGTRRSGESPFFFLKRTRAATGKW